jgi:fatty-acyl-CoA synthase
MYHANSWGIAFAAPATGAKLVLPGAQLDGASLFQLIHEEGVTVAAGVPTVWMGFLQHLSEHALRPSNLRRVIIGGAACSERLIRDFAALGIEPIHAWGMTEMSPVGGVCMLTPEVATLPFEAQLPWRIRQGRSPCGVELKLVGENGEVLPHDGLATGQLRVRGPAVVRSYYGDDRELLDDEGYFDSGDIATIDTEGFMRITDRAKDVIKSGGEWISSQQIENVMLLHPKVAVAAVVGVPHPKWGERPLLYTQLTSGQSATADELKRFLEGRIAHWWMPDDVVFVDHIPLGATGKVDKKALRAAARNR